MDYGRSGVAFRERVVEVEVIIAAEKGVAGVGGVEEFMGALLKGGFWWLPDGASRGDKECDGGCGGGTRGWWRGWRRWRN